jgi:hypothetical protein
MTSRSPSRPSQRSVPAIGSTRPRSTSTVASPGLSCSSRLTARRRPGAASSHGRPRLCGPTGAMAHIGRRRAARGRGRRGRVLRIVTESVPAAGRRPCLAGTVDDGGRVRLPSESSAYAQKLPNSVGPAWNRPLVPDRLMRGHGLRDRRQGRLRRGYRPGARPRRAASGRTPRPHRIPTQSRHRPPPGQLLGDGPGGRRCAHPVPGRRDCAQWTAIVRRI